MFDDDRSASRLGQLCAMHVERSLGTVLIRLRGEFDLGCVERFANELDGALAPSAEKLVLDLRRLMFIDSTGLRALVALKARTDQDGIEYTVLCRDGPVRRTLSETGLDGALPVVSEFGPVPRSDLPV